MGQAHACYGLSLDLCPHSVLLEIKAFAEKGSSRNKFSAFIRAGVDSGQIQGYRQKLQQSLGTFGVSLSRETSIAAN